MSEDNGTTISLSACLYLTTTTINDSLFEEQSTEPSSTCLRCNETSQAQGVGTVHDNSAVQCIS